MSSDQGRERQETRDSDKGKEKGANDIRVSGKLMALRELLWDAGIGKRSVFRTVDINSRSDDANSVVCCGSTGFPDR